MEDLWISYYVALRAIEDKFRVDIDSVVKQELENIRVKLLGKRRNNFIMKNMGRLSNEDKPKLGQAANKHVNLLNEKLQKSKPN